MINVYDRVPVQHHGTLNKLGLKTPDAFLSDAEDMLERRSETISTMHVLPELPEGAVAVQQSPFGPYPYNAALFLTQSLVKNGYDAGLAQARFSPSLAKKDMMYLGKDDAHILPLLRAGEISIPYTSDHFAYYNLLEGIVAKTMVVHPAVFFAGTSEHRMSLYKFAGFGDALLRMKQRGFMTSHLLWEASNVPNLAPLAPSETLKIPRDNKALNKELRVKAGLYQELHEQGIRPFSLSEMAEIALRSTLWQELDKITDPEIHTQPL